MENKVKYKERKKLSIALEKLIVSTTKVLLVIVTFLFLSTVYKYTLSRSFTFANVYMLEDNSKYDNIKKNIDKISELKENSKYSKENISDTSKFLNDVYNYTTKISKIGECDRCNYSEYIKKVEKYNDAVGTISKKFSKVRSIFEEKNPNINTQIANTYLCMQGNRMLSEAVPGIGFYNNLLLGNLNDIYNTYDSHVKSKLLYNQFLTLTEDIYEEVSNYE